MESLLLQVWVFAQLCVKLLKTRTRGIFTDILFYQNISTEHNPTPMPVNMHTEHKPACDSQKPSNLTTEDLPQKIVKWCSTGLISVSFLINTALEIWTEAR